MERVKIALSKDRSKILQMISQAPDGYVVEIRKPSRSLEQNALYWTLIREIADTVSVEGKRYIPDVWHRYFKQRFLPGKILEFPDGRVIETDPSTSDLTVDEFSEYINEVEQFKELHT